MEARVQLVKRELDVIFDSLQSSEPTPARLGLFMQAPSRPLPYSSSRNRDVYDAMKLTDSDPVDGDKVVLLYSSISVESGDRNREYLCGWNREHVWPQSRAGMSTYAPGIATDLHNIFPVDSSINSTRSNRSFGILDMDPDAVEVVDKSPIEGDGTLAGVLYTKDYWQPPPASRGVIARALMYMACTYHESGLKIVQGCGTKDMDIGDLDTILEWNDDYPPTEREKRRNDTVCLLQGNRNLFIDAPYMARRIRW